jgi:DNA invertase Pin-like site-specific DNA recombinase
VLLCLRDLPGRSHVADQSRRHAIGICRGHVDSQLEQLRAAGCGSRNIYREKVTGARADRRELNRMLGKLAPGDVVTVTRIDRLARSTFDLFCHHPAAALKLGARVIEMASRVRLAFPAACPDASLIRHIAATLIPAVP